MVPNIDMDVVASLNPMAKGVLIGFDSGAFANRHLIGFQWRSRMFDFGEMVVWDI